jgi:hypothetical protein
VTRGATSILLISALLVIAGTTSSYALWLPDDIPVAPHVGGQPENHQNTFDGSGGAFITWQDSRSGMTDIYSQRVDSSGVALWTADGIAICTA